MTVIAPEENTKLHAFYRSVVLQLFGTLRALKLYPTGHPEIEKKTGLLFSALDKYLKLHPNLTILFVPQEVVVENVPFPDIGKTLARVLERLEQLKLQRLMFSRGLKKEELLRFLDILLRLLETSANKEGAPLDSGIKQLPHVAVGSLPLDVSSQFSFEELAGALKGSRQALFSLSQQLRDLFAGVTTTLSAAKLSMARETVASIYRMAVDGEIPLKMIIYQRHPEPEPFLHAFNVAAFSMILGRQLHLEEGVLLDIGLGGLLHDIGFHLFATSAESMSTTSSLDLKMQSWEHPIRGAKFLAASKGLPELVPIVAYEHHLYYDGGGFPHQERPRQLNLASLVVAIANAFDNRREHRPGRAALSLADTIRWMDSQVGTRFHPVLYKRFRRLIRSQSEGEL
ncbi:MAG: HD domain-containing protein [Deltaproteobacteria bacterium]|nr:HD domain-containing protein [Deltaproteobacteria bacterium]MBW2070810.1 HD domain-containing protein [Deltaproteobacteria bacterium]